MTFVEKLKKCKLAMDAKIEKKWQEWMNKIQNMAKLAKISPDAFPI
jgi:hypothetical protein